MSAPTHVEPTTVRQRLNAALRSQLERDEAIILLGETIRSGGAAGVTAGLFDDFGPQRIIETPVSENGIFGAALGLALSGYRPVIEIYSADFLLAVANEIINDIAKWRVQHGQAGEPLPIVIRGCMGATAGLGPEHSQSMEPFFFHTPELQICVPSTPENAASLLDAAIASAKPTLFLEHRHVYEMSAPAPEGTAADASPGSHERVQSGTDLTMVAWGWMRTQAEIACARLAEVGVSVDLIDPRWIKPFDYSAVLESAARTGRLLVLEEAFITGSVGAELLARTLEHLPGRCEARRVAMPDVIHPYHAGMEKDILPDADSAAEAALRLVKDKP